METYWHSMWPQSEFAWALGRHQEVKREFAAIRSATNPYFSKFRHAVVEAEKAISREMAASIKGDLIFMADSLPDIGKDLSSSGPKSLLLAIIITAVREKTNG